MSKRMSRMLKWIEANPYEVFGDYRDTVTDEQAKMIISGKFDSFWESWSETEFNATDYVDWSSWEQEFADEFGLDDWDSVSETVKQVCYENRMTDCSDLLRTCLRNWRGHCCARLLHGNGEAIEFPEPEPEPEAPATDHDGDGDKPLPPDPEEKNDDRAGWAETAVQAFMAETGTDPGDAICDLIADLKHLCDRQPGLYGKFDAALRRGTYHYEEETQEV